jgi:hypothetical protein
MKLGENIETDVLVRIGHHSRDRSDPPCLAVSASMISAT